MPTFDSTEALKKEILRRMEKAAGFAEEEARSFLAEYNDRFYAEYTPVKEYIDIYGNKREGYTRTYQLRDSLYDTFGESNVESIGNGYMTTVSYNGEWDYTDAEDDRGWTTEEIVQANMYGHPQHKTAVWGDPIGELYGGKAYDILKRSLNKAGLPTQ